MNDIQHKQTSTYSDDVQITPAGVIVPDLIIYADLIAGIKRDLTITLEDSPFAPKTMKESCADEDNDNNEDGDNMNDKNTFLVYRTVCTGDNKYYIVPKFWYQDFVNPNNMSQECIDKMELHDCNLVERADAWLSTTGHNYTQMTDPKFHLSLRDYQEPIVETVVSKIKQEGGGILSVPCGRGKTCMAIKLATMLKTKCLVIVHRSDFILQWKADIEKFTNLKVGILRQNKIDVEGKDIVLGMLKSISMKDYHHSIFEEFGFVIVDEVHNISTRLYSRALCKLMPRYTLGLSATPKRDDGLDKIYRWFLGPVLYQETNTITLPVQIQMYQYQLSSKATALDKKRFKFLFNPRTRMANTPMMISNVCKVMERNDFIVNKLLDVLRNTPERKILLLSSRIDQLELLKEEFDKRKQESIATNDITTAMYIGGMKPEQYVAAKENDILFATFEMVGEGFNLEKLNTLIMCSPRSNSKTSNKLQQYVGRILRTQNAKIAPLVIDIHDKIKVFDNQGTKRLQYYRSEGYEIVHYLVSDKKAEYVRTETAIKIKKKM